MSLDIVTGGGILSIFDGAPDVDPGGLWDALPGLSSIDDSFVEVGRGVFCRWSSFKSSSEDDFITGTLYVRNNTFEAISLTVTEDTVNGWLLIEGDALPYTVSIPPLSEITLDAELHAVREANVSVSGTAHAEITIGLEPYIVDVEFDWLLVPVFYFKPNWTSPINETYEWATDIMRTEAGEEQRRSTREDPRQMVDFELLFKGDQAAEYESYMRLYQNRFNLLPLRYAPLTVEDLTVLGEGINEFKLLRGGSKDAMYDAISKDIYTDTVNVTRLYLEDEAGNWGVAYGPTIYSWEGDVPIFHAYDGDSPVSLTSAVKVYPLVLGTFDTDAGGSRITNGVLRASLSFTCDPVTYPPRVNPGNPEMFYVYYDNYNGEMSDYELYYGKPNWVSPLDSAIQHLYESIDSGYGAMDILKTEVHQRTLRKITWLLRNHAAAHDIRAFLFRRIGMNMPYYAPTWNVELHLLRSVGVGESKLEFKGTELYDTITNKLLTHRFIVMRMRNGQRRIFEIVSAEVKDGHTQVTLVSPLEEKIMYAEVFDTHYLLQWRLMSDRVSFRWTTDGVATCEVPITTLPSFQYEGYTPEP